MQLEKDQLSPTPTPLFINREKSESVRVDTLPQQREITKWDDIPDLNVDILRGIFSYGYESPSPIQKQAILPLIQKKDVIAQAQSGTGKTAAFAIGALSLVNTKENYTQILILSPTKELTIQTARVVSALGNRMSGLCVKTMYGGMDVVAAADDDIVPHIICGCPGRVYSMMLKKIIQPNKVRLIILDEADELLSSKYGNRATSSQNKELQGFKEQLYNIFQLLNTSIQVALFTATFPQYMESLITKIMRDPVVIKVEPEKLTLDGIKQYYISCYNDNDKLNILKDIYNAASLSQSIIYCNSVKRVAELYNALYKESFPVCCIHSNMDKNMRDKSFQEFITGKYRILISTDVTARGIDIQQVSLVINFDIPASKYVYLHRIGRSGRWGRKGVGINLVTKYDIHSLREIEGYYRCDMKELPTDLGAVFM